MTTIERFIELAIPKQDVEGEWRKIQAARRARVQLSVIDDTHTRAHISGDAADVDQVVGDLRAVGLGGRAAAGTLGPGTTS